MKKIFIVICSFLLIILSACNGVGDWVSIELPGRYAIWRINSRSIVLCLPREDAPFLADNVVDTYVFEVSYNDDLIFVKRADVQEDLKEKVDTSEPEYYVIEVKKEIRHGPFDTAQFEDFLMKLRYSEPLNWVSVTELDRTF